MRRPRHMPGPERALLWLYGQGPKAAVMPNDVPSRHLHAIHWFAYHFVRKPKLVLFREGYQLTKAGALHLAEHVFNSTEAKKAKTEEFSDDV